MDNWQEEKKEEKNKFDNEVKYQRQMIENEKNKLDEEVKYQRQMLEKEKIKFEEEVKYRKTRKISLY